MAAGLRLFLTGIVLFFNGVMISHAANKPVLTVIPALQFSASPTVDELFRARVFPEPLVVVGPQPSAAENADLARALVAYSKRSGPDDFSALTGFLQDHPDLCGMPRC